MKKNANTRLQKTQRGRRRGTNTKVRTTTTTRTVIRPRRRRNRNTIPAAIAKGFKRTFKIINTTQNSIEVVGRDLIYKIPELIDTTDNTTITCITANPAYWVGTRIASLAATYQNYRPLQLQVTYVPQCAVTQQGNVIAGTIWGEAPKTEALQQALRTSNGGILTQAYKTATSTIKLASNLQYNLYNMSTELNPTSNPFYYMAIAIGATDSAGNKIVPGYFYVTYRYVLKNPLGAGIEYFNSGKIQMNAMPDTVYENATIILASDAQVKLNAENLITLPKGTLLQYENDVYNYEGQLVEFQDNLSYIYMFANRRNAPSVAPATPPLPLIVEVEDLSSVSECPETLPIVFGTMSRLIYLQTEYEGGMATYIIQTHPQIQSYSESIQLPDLIVGLPVEIGRTTYDISELSPDWSIQIPTARIDSLAMRWTTWISNEKFILKEKEDENRKNEDEDRKKKKKETLAVHAKGPSAPRSLNKEVDTPQSRLISDQRRLDSIKVRPKSQIGDKKRRKMEEGEEE